MLEDILSTLLYVIVRIVVLWTLFCWVVPFGAVYQEYKIWNADTLPSLNLWGMLTIYAFNVYWVSACSLGALIIFPKYLVMGDASYEAHIVESTVARRGIAMFVGPVEVRGEENLPSENPGSPAPIYIANHASELDVASVYYIYRRFKWIAKESILLMPGVGQIMWLGKHVLINRKHTKKDKSSNSSNLYEKSNEAVQSGIPMFIYPQGTRWMAERLPFKFGAMNIAMHNKSNLIPISIDIPKDALNRLYPLCLWNFQKQTPVVLTIHKPIQVTGTEDKEELAKQCSDLIYSVLPPVPESKKKK
eukprot:CAMPEP_0194027560 /NCGR_PEP_ID=MMETSP0009_2-20130614/1703_1 /TAXON_ID=210454 /ORGANISM="Grammatophora oceanica, Strain CCMP 410" /LENGTH=303 /DNA_ID=CAMNT_0038666679 /DNA_START=112 /DNA_END=1023 /DNA_ORIENTATION=-